MNKKYLFILVAAMVLLCVSSAYAEYFSASLPADEYISDACSLDGSHLAVLTNAHVYQVDLETGESLCLAPRLEGTTFLCCSEDGGIYTVLSDDSSAYVQRLYRIDTASSAWVEDAVITLEQETYGAVDAAFVGELLFITLTREGQPSLLASYDRQQGETEEYGSFGINVSVSSCTLQKMENGKWVYAASLAAPSSKKNSTRYTVSKDYSSYMTTGVTYRIIATFNADGDTVTKTSNSFTY